MAYSLGFDIGAVLSVRIVPRMDKYFRRPPMIGQSKRETFQYYKDQFRRCVDNWNLCYLSQGGQGIFICSVL